MNASGVNGQVSLDGSLVTIRREGLKARMGHGSGERSFAASEVQSVVFKPAGFATNGLVVFKLRDEPKQTVPDLSHANSVIFKKADTDAFRGLVDAVNALRTQ